eukprot:scaffold259_cov578-Prasinococcus_capsulatus_cf.AAC.7
MSEYGRWLILRSNVAHPSRWVGPVGLHCWRAEGCGSTESGERSYKRTPGRFAPPVGPPSRRSLSGQAVPQDPLARGTCAAGSEDRARLCHDACCLGSMSDKPAVRPRAYVRGWSPSGWSARAAHPLGATCASLEPVLRGRARATGDVPRAPGPGSDAATRARQRRRASEGWMRARVVDAPALARARRAHACAGACTLGAPPGGAGRGGAGVPRTLDPHHLDPKTVGRLPCMVRLVWAWSTGEGSDLPDWTPRHPKGGAGGVRRRGWAVADEWPRGGVPSTSPSHTRLILAPSNRRPRHP